MTAIIPPVGKTSVLIIGPVTPFRSSIATHLTALAEEFESIEDTEILVISFKSLYPSWLFPGKSDLNDERNTPNVTAVDYILSSFNPLTWLRAVRKAKHLNPDIVVVPLWSFYPAACLGWIANRCRRHGLKVTTIIHNLTDHEQSPLKNTLLHYQARASDTYLFHSEAAATSFSMDFPTNNFKVHPLPIGRGFPIQLNEQSIGIDHECESDKPGTNLLFFGLIRAYKGLDIALQALALIKDQAITLTVAGEAWSSLDDIQALITKLEISHRVTLIPRYVSEEEASYLFRQCDLVLLPYRTIFSSGVLPLAYAFGKPAVVSDLPGLVEQIDHGYTGWVVPDYTPECFARVIQDALMQANRAQTKSAIKQKALSLNWNTYASSILALNRNPARPNENGN